MTATKIQDILFPAAVVGSMPRPDYVRDLIGGDVPLSEADYSRRMDNAVRYIVSLQEQAGLDIVSDGEWRRKSYIGVIAELAHGFEVSVNPSDGRPWTIVTDRLAPKNSGFIAREASFLNAATSRPFTVALPSPGLLGERMWDPVRSKKAYPTREDFVKACVPILRQEIELLAQENAAIIQIDDPHICLFVDESVRNSYDDVDAALDFAVAMVNDTVEDCAEIKTAVHLCRRAGARARGEASFAGEYSTILKHLNRLNVNHLTMEFTTAGSGDFDILGKLREDFGIGLGCVSTDPGIIDSPEVIVARVERALDHIGPERITLNPDCGFAPGSAAKISIDEVYQKLKNETEAAKQLRARYS